jgi:hypothetical protein
VGLHLVRRKTVPAGSVPLWGSSSRSRSRQDDEEVVKFTPEVQEQIRNRSKGRCEMCGALALYHQIHHRRPRGMGGSKDPACGTAANGLFVHPACHAKIESNREQAYQRGHLVRQGQDPAKVPVRRGMVWYLLGEDGSLTPSPQGPLGGE